MLTDTTDPLRASYWHVGLVVADLESAMAELTSTTGAEFLPVQERPDGEDTIRVSFTTGAPHIELIEGNPQGLWPTLGGARLDHLAYWSADFDEDCSRFEDRGLDREAGGRSVWGGNWAYYRMAASGLRVELCDTAGRKAFLERWGMETEHVDDDHQVVTANGPGSSPVSHYSGSTSAPEGAGTHTKGKP